MGEDGNPTDQELLLRTGRCWGLSRPVLPKAGAPRDLEGTLGPGLSLLPWFAADRAVFVLVDSRLNCCSSQVLLLSLLPQAKATCGGPAASVPSLLFLPRGPERPWGKGQRAGSFLPCSCWTWPNGRLCSREEELGWYGTR